eukprot:362925-Chlamydomonas_euryale.AAC.1
MVEFKVQSSKFKRGPRCRFFVPNVRRCAPQESNSLLRSLAGMHKDADDCGSADGTAGAGGAAAGADEAAASARTQPALHSRDRGAAADEGAVLQSHAADDDSTAAQVDASALLARLAACGAVVEAPTPDFGAHGVATALHTFPAAALRRLGLLPWRDVRDA